MKLKYEVSPDAVFGSIIGVSLLIMLGGCLRHNPSVVGGNSAPSLGATKLDPTYLRHTFPVVFDVPALIGKNEETVSRLLGKPSVYTPPASWQIKRSAAWDKQWTRKGQFLLVTYNPQDGRINNFFLSTRDPSGVTTDLNAVRVAGNLTSPSTRYTIERVDALGQPGKYTGLRVIPR